MAVSELHKHCGARINLLVGEHLPAKTETSVPIRIYGMSVRKREIPLPGGWEEALGGWETWLRVAGRRELTVRLRSDLVRSIARRSATNHPRDLTLNTIVGLCSERPWSAEHRRAVRTSLIGFYDYAMKMEITGENPARRLPKIAAPAPAPRPTPDDVWSALLAAAPPRERLMALLAGEAGLRRAEVATVHCDDLIQDLHGWSLLVHGKGGKQRVVPLTDRLAGEIRAYRGGGFLFPGQVDGHISPKQAGTAVSRLMSPGWSMHKLRHRFATRGYAGTGNLRAVQEALGHASVATTQRYTAVSRRDIRSVCEAAGGRIDRLTLTGAAEKGEPK